METDFRNEKNTDKEPAQCINMFISTWTHQEHNGNKLGRPSYLHTSYGTLLQVTVDDLVVTRANVHVIPQHDQFHQASQLVSLLCGLVQMYYSILGYREISMGKKCPQEI